jgi:hypothetical protein
MNSTHTDHQIDELAERLRYQLTMQLAACIRRAYEGPRGGGLQDHVSRDHPQNEYYWYTREACHAKARELGVFFPDVIGQFEHVTHTIGKSKLQELSQPFWYEVMHPDLLVSEVMES